MKNWAKTLSFNPSSIEAPASIEEIQNLVKRADEQNKTIRTVGSAHSWTGLYQTTEWLCHLDNFQGLLAVDKENKKVTAKAGTKLHQFTHECFKHGLSFANQGDVDKQSLAGATSTGTHGTGINLQSSSNLIEGIKLITASGEILSINSEQNSELLPAAKLSLGSLGILTEIEFKMRKAYKLQVKIFPKKMDEILEDLPSLLKKHRHVEFFYFPIGEWVMVKIMDETHEPVTHRGLLHKINEVALENWLFEGFNISAKFTKQFPFFDQIMQKFVSSQKFTAWAHQAFPSERSVRFWEMEYNLDIQHFTSALKKIRDEIKLKKFQTLFPIEIRFVKGDNLWLSPAYGRDSVYFAIHAYRHQPFLDYFLSMQDIFKSFDGRPHWGKWHNLKKADLLKVYPHFQAFCDLRRELDPQGRFLNTHLREILC
jgi:FAD-linked oxidoreductase